MPVEEDGDRHHGTVRISFGELSTGGMEDGRPVRLPLARLRDGFGHVHGSLQIDLAGTSLPIVGQHSGDVCLGDWTEGLEHVVASLQEREGRCRFDPGGQGEPAYAFARTGEELLVELIEGAGGGAPGHDDHPVTVRVDDFTTAVTSFVGAVEAAVVRAAGPAGVAWQEERRRRSGQR